MEPEVHAVVLFLTRGRHGYFVSNLGGGDNVAGKEAVH